MTDQHANGIQIVRRVQIGVVLAILAQIGGGFWWASNLSTRVTTIEQADTQAIDVRLARVETQLVDVKAAVNRIENLMLARRRRPTHGAPQ